MGMKWNFNQRNGIGRLLILFCLGMALLYGCGSDDDDSDNTTSGTFTDSPVAGLTFDTQTQSGTTDAHGTFHYRPTETVTFSVGGMALGSATGASVITPVDLVAGGTTDHQAVINIARLLQTLDADGDNNNGIQISSAIANVIASQASSIDFDQPADDFAADTAVTGLLAELNAAGVFTDLDPRDRSLKSATLAQTHLVAGLSDRITVQTTYGQLRGYGPTDTTWQWLGIPYAKPPVGDLRWRAPEAPDAWTDVREATAWSDQAAQPVSYQAFGLGGMSEDCLYLNVTAPRDAQDLPVMVYFHGGGFRILTNNVNSFNNPASLPTKDVVLVTVNHRLGPLGYLAHPDLSAEAQTESGDSSRGSGNYGQMDLIAALEWIQENIEAFGGDPDIVTIFGESGGGGKVHHLIGSPEAAGLFQRAIIQSGNYTPDTTGLADAEAQGEALATALGVDAEVDVVAAMRAKTWVEIIAAGTTSGFNALPNVDGYILPDTVRNIMEADQHNDVPLIMGGNREDLDALITQITTDLSWWGDNMSSLYAYVFGHVMTGWAAEGGVAYHGIELIYVFNYPASAYTHFALGLTGLTGDTPPDLGWGTADMAVVDTMMTMWTNFAYTGNPSISGTVDWAAYTSAGDNYLEIGQGGTYTMQSPIADAF